MNTVTSIQEKFLLAFEEFGHDGAAASIVGVTTTLVGIWKREEHFNLIYNDAFLKFSGSLVKEALVRGRDGYQSPIVYKGELQYLKDELGELLLDDDLRPIPATIIKKSDRLLQMALRANIKEYQPNSSIELTGVDGQPISNNITVEFIKSEGSDNG